MSWTRAKAPAIALALAVLVLAVVLPSARSAEERRVAIYGPARTAVLPVVERDRQDYVDLARAVEPLGAVQVTRDGKTFRLRLAQRQLELREGRTQVKAGRDDFHMAGKLWFEGDRALAPLSALTSLLSRLSGARVDHHETTRRIFIGEVANTFRAERRGEGAVALTFAEPVQPGTSSEPNKFTLTFRENPVVGGPEPIRLEDRYIKSVAFSEGNGAAQITVQTSAPVVASFADGNRTIVFTAAPPAVAAAPAAEPPRTTAAPPQPVASAPAAAATVQSAARAAVVIDAAHGGQEPGTRLAASILEKEITLAFARRLRTELQNRGVTVVLLRDDDATLTLEQRSRQANALRPELVVSLHSAASGGTRLYTTMLPPAPATIGLPRWETAQQSHLPASRVAAAAIHAALQERRFPARRLTAPLPLLDTLAAPAVAIEVAPVHAGPEALRANNTQQAMAEALAAAIAQARKTTGARP